MSARQRLLERVDNQRMAAPGVVGKVQLHLVGDLEEGLRQGERALLLRHQPLPQVAELVLALHLREGEREERERVCVCVRVCGRACALCV